MKSIVTPRWHLIVHQKHGEQLFDWQADPAELKDVARTPEGSAVIPSLRGQLLNY
jgi:hypothetical protein